MNAQDSLIDQLEGALASKELSKRGEVLRRVTDLFVYDSGKFTDEQIDLFDEIMSKLVENIEIAARAAFGSRLAKVVDAPVKTSRMLAFDDAIAVAAPILEHSPRLDEAGLADNARTRSQGHMLAIAGRSILTEPVTDILVDRGNNEVAARTASNGGAKFSTSGVSKLVQRARDNGDLAMCIWSRPDIPREDLLKLFVRASEKVKVKLEAADPRRAALIRAAVADASEEVQATARAGSYEHTQALEHVRSLHSLGKLDEARLLGFVRGHNFDKAAVALSLMCDLPIGLIERALVQSEREQLLVLAKAIDLSRETTKAILTLQGGRTGVGKERLDQCFASFFRLQPKTARAALQFYRLREKSSPELFLSRLSTRFQIPAAVAFQFYRFARRLTDELFINNASYLPLVQSRAIHMVYEIERAIPTPQVEIIIQRRARRQVFRDGSPLTTGGENIHEAVHDLAHNHCAFVATAPAWRDQRFDQFPFVVGEVAGIA